MKRTDVELKEACHDLHYEMWMMNQVAHLLDEEQEALLQRAIKPSSSEEFAVMSTRHTSGPTKVVISRGIGYSPLIELNEREATIHNALIESFCIHARSLLDFFFPDEKTPRRTNAQARQFFATAQDWEDKYKRPTEGEIVRLQTRVNTEIAHLTYDRQGKALLDKIWPTREMADQLNAVFQVFRSSISPELIPNEWQ